MAAAPIDLSAGLVPKPIDLSAGLVPKADAPVEKSLLQRAKDKFDALTTVTPEQTAGHGAIVNAVQKFGAGAIQGLAQPFVHPIDTFKNMAQAANDPLAGQKMVQGAVENPAQTAGNIVGGAILGEAASPAVSAAARIAPRIPGALSEGKAAFTNTTYPKNLSLTPEEATAQQVVKTLQPDPAAVPNIKSASPEIPDALAYAQRKGIPQNGKLDTAKALQGRADEIQAHYDDAILKPNTSVVQTVPANYEGVTVGENKATLGQINDRVDAINKELKSNFRKKLSSQTIEANASDADLLNEKGSLTNILHDKLGELTGIPPEDIADIRQRAGKLRSLAQEVTDSANKDTLAAGRREVSAGTFSLRNPLEAIQDKVGGGQEVIGNRSWKQTLGEIQPAEKPLPQPNAPGPNVPTTPAAAQAEFLRAQQLEQGSQDAAVGRSQATQTYRGEQAQAQQAAAQREFLRSTQLEQGAQDATAGRADTVSSVRAENIANKGGQKQLWAEQGLKNVKAQITSSPNGLSVNDVYQVANTPKGRELLIRASDLSPGSLAMKNLAKDLSTLVKASSRP